MKIYNYDTVILGGGPAGLSAAIYASRGAVSTALLDINALGGQPSNYLELENYPGFSRIGGYELMEKFEEQADSFGVKKFSMQEIESIDLLSFPKVVKTKEAQFNAKSIILAMGAKPKKLGVKGEAEFVGRGVSYCAICDGAFFKDKVIAVVGGGNSAVEEAIFLTKFAQKVYLVHRRDNLRADKILQEKLFLNKKIEVLYNSEVIEIVGDDLVNSIQIKNVVDNTVKELKTDAVFPYIGIYPNVEFVNGQIVQDSCGFIVTDSTMKTSVDGVYAVGDIRVTPLRQVVTASSDGAIGAVYSLKYLESLINVTV